MWNIEMDIYLYLLSDNYKRDVSLSICTNPIVLPKSLFKEDSSKDLRLHTGFLPESFSRSFPKLCSHWVTIKKP